jgi:hypothetical protein
MTRIKVAKGSSITLFIGIVIMSIGIVIFLFAIPSPHGLIELVIALPIFALGSLITSMALIRRPNIVPRLVGWIVLIVTTIVLLYYLSAIFLPLLEV